MNVKIINKAVVELVPYITNKRATQHAETDW